MRPVRRVLPVLLFAASTVIAGSASAARLLPGRDRWYRETVLRKAPGGGTNCHVFGTDEAGARVFASCRGWIYALDATTGATVWQFSTGGAAMKMAGVVVGGAVSDAIRGLDASAIRPLLTGDAVVSASGFRHQLVALSRADGRLLWSYGSSGAFRAPLVTEGGVVCLVTAELACLKLESGTPLWRAPSPDDEVRVRPVLAGGKLWVAASRGTLFAFDRATGERRLDVKLSGRIAGLAGAPAGRLAALLADGGGAKARGEIVLIDADGAQRHRFPVGSATAPPLFIGGLLCHAESEGGLACRDAETGRPLWSAPATGEAVQSTPVPHGEGLLTLDAFGRLRFLSRADGSTLWIRRACFTPDGPPVPAASAIYCGCKEGIEAMLWPDPVPRP